MKTLHKTFGRFDLGRTGRVRTDCSDFLFKRSSNYAYIEDVEPYYPCHRLEYRDVKAVGVIPKKKTPPSGGGGGGETKPPKTQEPPPEKTPAELKAQNFTAEESDRLRKCVEEDLKSVSEEIEGWNSEAIGATEATWEVNNGKTMSLGNTNWKIGEDKKGNPTLSIFATIFPQGIGIAVGAMFAEQKDVQAKAFEQMAQFTQAHELFHVGQLKAIFDKTKAVGSERPTPSQDRVPVAAICRKVATVPQHLSPECYPGRMQFDGQECLSRAWLYVLLRRDREQGGDLSTYLPRRGKKYRPRPPSDASSSNIPNRIDIDLGHWEIDTVIERYSRWTQIRVLPHRAAEDIACALVELLLPVAPWVQTLTADNGLEFARHEYAAQALNAQFYFCKPYHSWQRGPIEQLNGLVRRTFPKTQSFRTVTPAAVAATAQKLNHLPRKCLGFQTPQEVFDALRAPGPPQT